MRDKRQHFHSNFDIEIDLHGLNAEDAIREIDHILYTKPSSGILIIHGKGDGVLKKTIREHLKNHKMAKEVLAGEDLNYPGGDGVTIVYTF